MFNKKRIKELEQLLELEKNKNESLMRKLDNLSSLARQISNDLIRIGTKIDPKPIPNYNVDAKNFAKKLQSFQKKQQCGANGCRQYYSIPSNEIDSVALA